MWWTGPPGWDFGGRPTIWNSKKGVRKPKLWLLNSRTGWNRPRQWKRIRYQDSDFDVHTLYRAGVRNKFVKNMDKYKTDIHVLQEI